MAKQVKKQNAKPEPKQAPSAADFLKQPQETPAPEATPEPPAPPAEQPAAEQEPVQDVRETIRYPRRGDDCPTGKCPGKLISFSRARAGKKLILFLKCSACNAKPTPNKQVI